MRRALVLFSLLFSVTVPFGWTVAAETYTPIKPLPEAARKRLMRYVASEDTDAFLADSLVGPRLKRLLGAKLSHLQQNLDVRGAVAFQSGMVYVDGNASHGGGEEHGFVGVDAYSGRVCAAIYSSKQFTVYGAGTDRYAVPVALRSWILGTWAYVSLEGSIPATTKLVEETPKR
jgi:hypothetical protein